MEQTVLGIIVLIYLALTTAIVSSDKTPKGWIFAVYMLVVMAFVGVICYGLGLGG